MGRPRTPIERQIRLGNPGKRRLPDVESMHRIAGAASTGSVPDPLRPLGRAGREWWDRILAAGSTWIAVSDLEMAQQVAEQIDEQQALRRQVLDPEPYPGRWRDRLALRQLDDRIRIGLGELGFSPSSRARLGLAIVTAEAVDEKTADRRDRRRERRGKMFDDNGLVERSSISD